MDTFNWLCRSLIAVSVVACAATNTGNPIDDLGGGVGGSQRFGVRP